MVTDLFLFFFLTVFAAGTTVPRPQDNSINVSNPLANYKVRYLLKNDLQIDGSINEKSWKTCDEIKNLICPWDSYCGGTAKFRAGYDKNFFYFSFHVTDRIGSYLPQKNEMAVVSGDRVEIFFSADDSMSNYYCLEIAPNGNLLDYQASYHRKFNNTWNVQGKKIIGKPNKTGYMVEGKIPVDFFRLLTGSKASLQGSVIRAGVFRARKKNTSNKDPFTWYSWIDPKVANPDFHVPSALGSFEFDRD